MADVKTDLTIEDVEAEVARIQEMRFDDEAAHSAEDRLWENVLRTIASGYGAKPSALARAALKTTEIDFARWCA